MTGLESGGERGMLFEALDSCFRPFALSGGPPPLDAGTRVTQMSSPSKNSPSVDHAPVLETFLLRMSI